MIGIRSTQDIAAALGASIDHGGLVLDEHRTHRSVRFFATEQLARQWLAYNPITKC